MELLKELTAIWGISGFEKDVSEFIAQRIIDHVDELRRDAIGNLIAVKRGSAKTADKKKIMCAGHMDEIGLNVVAITSEGYLKVKPVGGVSTQCSFMQRVLFKNGTIGLVGCTESIEKVEPRAVDKLYIDIGATSKEDALKYVSIGSSATFIGDFVELTNRNVMSKAFDDRIGCYLMIKAIENMDTPYHDVYFVFTVQEEVGLIGAITSAEGVNPDLGIALDISGCFDVPNAANGNIVLGGGAAIKVNDGSVICDGDLVDAMVSCAIENDIKYQLDPLAAGGTDAGGINRSNAGVKAVGISLATRYGHSPSNIINMNDVDACVTLLTKYVSSPLTIETEKIYK